MKPQGRNCPRGSAKQVGIARFRPDDWSKWVEIVDDPEKLGDSHADWLRDATAMADRLRQAGLKVVWVDIEPETFSHWCQSRDIPNDLESRSRYAAEQIGNLPAPAGEG
jgi:hypothetical protein